MRDTDRDLRKNGNSTFYNYRNVFHIKFITIPEYLKKIKIFIFCSSLFHTGIFYVVI